MDEGDGLIFISAISNGEKQLDYNQTMVCSKCGHFGRLNVFMTYMYFSLFFIPLIFWNRKYYVKSTCCNTLYSLSPEIGKKIRRGEQVNISEMDLKPMERGEQTSGRYCPSCGYLSKPDFEYCPKCGSSL